MIVLDTCAVIWDALQPQKLSSKAKKEIEKNHKDETLFLCEISLWEIAILMRADRIHVDVSYSEFIKLILNARNFQTIGITPEISELSVFDLCSLPKDPADRIIAATTKHLNAKLVTADKKLRKSKQIETFW